VEPRTKIVGITIILVSAVFFVLGGIRTFRKHVLGIEETLSPPSQEIAPIQKQSVALKHTIEPIVIKEDTFFDDKPESMVPGDWDTYNKKKIAKMKAETSPELLKKLQEEFKERQNPDVEQNMKRLDAQIEKLQRKISADSSDVEGKERLKSLLDVQAKFKYLQEMFINEEESFIH
jgi:hypothetical protein